MKKIFAILLTTTLAGSAYGFTQDISRKQADSIMEKYLLYYDSIQSQPLLPEDAAALLVRSADKARTLPIGSLARAKCLEVAAQKVRFVYPRFFRLEEEAPSSMRPTGSRLFDSEDEGGSQ